MTLLRLAIVFGIALLGLSRGQEEDGSMALFRAAIEAMGGDAHGAVRDVVSDGHLFLFDREGASSNYIKFNDYTKLPDKSRYELGNNKKARDVSVFNLEIGEGWILEGQKPTRAAGPEEMKEFRNAAKHSIDNIFRTRYRDPSNKLFYLGPGQGADVKYEMVKLLDPDNDEVTVYFDRAGKLPAKIAYTTRDKQGIVLRHQDEFSQWHTIQGVLTAKRIDGNVNGRRASQTFIFNVAYNTGLTDDFFVKPVPVK